MDAEQRFILMLTLLGGILLCIVVLVLFVALWPYRLIIGFVLIGLVALIFLLVCGVTINEQILRYRRVKFKAELPLGRDGRPLYLQEGMKPYREGERDE